VGLPLRQMSRLRFHPRWRPIAPDRGSHLCPMPFDQGRRPLLVERSGQPRCGPGSRGSSHAGVCRRRGAATAFVSRSSRHGAGAHDPPRVPGAFWQAMTHPLEGMAGGMNREGSSRRNWRPRTTKGLSQVKYLPVTRAQTRHFQRPAERRFRKTVDPATHTRNGFGSVRSAKTLDGQHWSFFPADTGYFGSTWREGRL
jgi:hypothetical protein